MTALYEIGPFRLDAEPACSPAPGSPSPWARAGSRSSPRWSSGPTRCRRRPASWMRRGRASSSRKAISPCRSRRSGACSAQAPEASAGWRRSRGAAIDSSGPSRRCRTLRRKALHAQSRRTNLPEPLTSFIGRERELVEIKRLLPTTRLLTLVGIGGIGKTRLALQAGRRSDGRLSRRCLVRRPGAARRSALVPSAVAQVLGVSEAAGKPLLETLCSQVKSAPALAGARQLRASARRVRAARRRDAAQRGGADDHRHQSRALAGRGRADLPAAAAVAARSVGERGQRWRRSEAVQLFVDRAQRQQPEFELTAARAPAVAQLCIHLDGIPLALELAAARVRSLSIEQINARLDDRFRLLTGGTRTALPRQQTLRGTLDWSHGLLVGAGARGVATAGDLRRRLHARSRRSRSRPTRRSTNSP